MQPPAERNENNTMPTVSVIIPAYNAAAYICETLDSVFAQTFSDYEVIVVNDGSPDIAKLERVIEPYRERIVYIKQENRGPSGARNTAIMAARGEYVAFLDSDDLWLPEFLSHQVKMLSEDDSLALVYADALLFGDSALAGQTFMQGAPSEGAVTFESLLRWECAIITSCVVARKQSLIDAGLFDEAFVRSEDFDLWLRLAHRRHSSERIAYSRAVLARHRLHEASLAADSRRMFESQIDVLKKLAQTLDLTGEDRELITTQVNNCEAQLVLDQGKQQLLAGKYGEAAVAIKQANNFFRSRKLQFVLLGLRTAPRLLHRFYKLRPEV